MYLLRKWISIIAFALCLSLCLSFIAFAEEEEEVIDEIDERIIDFSFNFMTLPEEEYARIKTDYPRKELSLLSFLYYDFDGVEQEGQIIVNHHLEYDAIDALQDLYDANLPIDEISYFTSEGFSICFKTQPVTDEENDPYNQIFGVYGFVWNENQANGIREYNMDYRIPEWYP